MSDTCPASPTPYPSDCEVTEGLRALARQRKDDSSDPARQALFARAAAIRLLLLDVDGVLTDGTLLYGGQNEESKAFHTQDGFGIRLLREAGIDVGVITARSSAVVARRAEELKMRFIYQGVPGKREAFREILRLSGLRPYEIAYMGDDWLDLVLLQQVGLAVAPANAVVEVKRVVHLVTERQGGHGAVREACDLLLAARNLTAELLQRYSSS
jgi:3-deoxy-D-manno-octulosonate 8-phosphate phosphatase (KDO 8-P phosphatase)